MPIEQGLDAPAQFVVAAASALQKGGAFARRQLQGFDENRHVTIEGAVHQIVRIVPDVILQIKWKCAGNSSLIFIKPRSFGAYLNKLRSSVHENKATFNPQKAKGMAEKNFSFVQRHA